MFIHTNQPLITSFYIKKVPIFAELAMSQRWSAIFCATGAWGGKPFGRVRVNSFIQKWFTILVQRKVSAENMKKVVSSDFAVKNAAGVLNALLNVWVKICNRTLFSDVKKIRQDIKNIFIDKIINRWRMVSVKIKGLKSILWETLSLNRLLIFSFLFAI